MAASPILSFRSRVLLAFARMGPRLPPARGYGDSVWDDRAPAICCVIEDARGRRLAGVRRGREMMGRTDGRYMINAVWQLRPCRSVSKPQIDDVIDGPFDYCRLILYGIVHYGAWTPREHEREPISLQDQAFTAAVKRRGDHSFWQNMKEMP